MVHGKFSLLKKAAHVKKHYGKSYLSQAADIVKLRFGFPRLGPSEYYQFGLFDDRRYPFPEKLKFMGWRGREFLDRTFNRRSWHVIHSDKIITYMLLERLDMPYPRLQAVFDIAPRAIPGLRYLTTKESLEAFLREAAYPIFVKPADAALGRGVFLAEGFDRERNVLRLTGGKHMSTDSFYDICRAEAERGAGGYIFQHVVKPAPEVSRVTGGRLAGLRLIVLTAHGRPVLTHALIKIPTGHNITDNFDGGRTGNLLGRVNPGSGKVEEVFAFSEGVCRKVDSHPDTSVPLAEMAVPAWSRYHALALAAASVFPGLRLQHWDMAISENGPVILEVNIDGCLDLPQIAYQRGFYDGAIREEFLKLRRRRRVVVEPVGYVPAPSGAAP